MENTGERYLDLARKAVKRYLLDTSPEMQKLICKLREYSAGTSTLDGKFAFSAELHEERTLLVIVDPDNFTVQVTDVNGGNDTTRSYEFANFLGLLYLKK